jgi:hypothetical protein
MSTLATFEHLSPWPKSARSMRRQISSTFSQPALSRRIQKVEEMLGVVLLRRTTRRVDLTTVGRHFLPKARNVLDDLDTALL